MHEPKPTSHALLILGLFAIYAGFVIWMYVTEPLLLLVFGVALAIIALRESGSRFLRAIAPAKVRNRSML
jgi:hypothetical protein